MQQRVSPSTEVHAGFHSPHFLLLPFLPAAAHTHAPLLSLAFSLWEFLHALEGISHWMPFSLPLVGNIFFKLALGSFEGNPDIVGKRGRGQLKKKKKKYALFSVCYKFAIQAEKNKLFRSCNWYRSSLALCDTKTRSSPRPSAVYKQGAVSHWEKGSLASIPTSSLSSFPCFPVIGERWTDIRGPAWKIPSCPRSHMGLWEISASEAAFFNSVRHLPAPLRGRKTQGAQLIFISKWDELGSHQDLPPRPSPAH